MYLGAVNRSRIRRRHTLRGLGGGEAYLAGSGCPGGYWIGSATETQCAPGFVRPNAPYGTYCCPVPQAPSSGSAPITVSPNIVTQVSPQISPQFVQQFQPSGSPVNAGATMGPVQEPRIIALPIASREHVATRQYESQIPTEGGQTALSFDVPTGPVLQERASAPVIPTGADMTIPMIAPEGAGSISRPNWALYAAIAAAGIAVIFVMQKRGRK